MPILEWEVRYQLINFYEAASKFPFECTEMIIRCTKVSHI